MWKKDQKQKGNAYRKGHTKSNDESTRRQSKKVSETLRRLYSEGKIFPITENPKIRGEKHHNWQGGVATINEKIRRSIEYKLWRKAVFERDNYTCKFCGNKGRKINADHIKPFSQYPELRFAIDNGRTLCEKCHRTTETYGGNSRCSKKN